MLLSGGVWNENPWTLTPDRKRKASSKKNIWVQHYWTSELISHNIYDRKKLTSVLF